LCQTWEFELYMYEKIFWHFWVPCAALGAADILLRYLVALRRIVVHSDVASLRRLFCFSVPLAVALMVSDLTYWSLTGHTLTCPSSCQVGGALVVCVLCKGWAYDLFMWKKISFFMISSLKGCMIACVVVGLAEMLRRSFDFFEVRRELQFRRLP
jgi:TRAP-type C4-dicarboxylate transport system permease large subunit